MNKYYFLLCSLPSINIGSKPEISFVDLKNYLDWNLSDKDKSLLYIFRQYTDIKNLKNLWLGLKIDPRGNLDEKTLQEAFLTKDFFPEYVFEYVKKFPSNEDKINNFSSLEGNFLILQQENLQSEFLRSYFLFEREVKLILVALRSKNLNKDLMKELFWEDKLDPFFQNIASQTTEREYSPPKEYEVLKEMFVKLQKSPKVLYRSFLEYCLSKYMSFSEKDPFTIDQILGYLASLMLVEDYFYLNDEKGRSIVDSLL